MQTMENQNASENGSKSDTVSVAQLCEKLATELEHKTDNFTDRTLHRLSSGEINTVGEEEFIAEGCLTGDEYDTYDLNLSAHHLELCSCYRHKGGPFRARSVCTHVGAVIVHIAKQSDDPLDTVEEHASELNDSVKQYRDELSRVSGMVDTLGIEDRYSKTRAEAAEREGRRTIQLDDTTWVVRGGKHNGHKVNLTDKGYESECHECAEMKVPAGCELGAMVVDTMDTDPVDSIDKIDAGRMYTVEGVCHGTKNRRRGPDQKGYLELDDGSVLEMTIWDTDRHFEAGTRYRIRNAQVTRYQNTLQLNINETTEVADLGEIEEPSALVEKHNGSLAVPTDLLTEVDLDIFDSFLEIKDGYLQLDKHKFDENQPVYRSDIIEAYKQRYEFVSGESGDILEDAFNHSDGEIFQSDFQHAKEYDRVTVIGEIKSLTEHGTDSKGPVAVAEIDTISNGVVDVKFWVERDISEGERIAVVGGKVGFFRNNKEINVNEDTPTPTQPKNKNEQSELS